MNNVQTIEGYLVKNTCPFSREQVEIKMQSDEILKRGLLLVGGARQGKTNVIKKIASDILNKKKQEDAVVFLDVKGDYYETFFKKGDMVLDPINEYCIWNFFEELKILPFTHELDAKVREIVEYLFYGQESTKEPFWTNAAKLITYCFIMYMLMEADENDDDSNLNHERLCEIIDGEFNYVNDDNINISSIYDSYRGILNSYDKFRAIGIFLPPLNSGFNMGVSIITEIIVMRQKLFIGAFGKKRTNQEQFYISSGTFSMLSNSKVLFLQYNPKYQNSCATVFRCFIDMLIVAYLDNRNKKGKLYLIFDEIALIPELNQLDHALNLGAQAGVRVLAGLQEIEQLRHSYQSNPHRANVIIGAFQNAIVFNSDVETIEYMQKRFGEALVRRMVIRPGGGIGYTDPMKVPTIEKYEFGEFDVGDAVISFLGKKAFKFHFPFYA